jgi:CheY-like chemotaxis protein
MAKKILLAEAADAVRQVIEALLRQNGYDVIGVNSAARASEVLQFGRPDLIVTGGDLVDRGQRPFYDIVQSDPKTTSIPLLVIEPPDKTVVSLPPEVVIARPVDPKDFLQRVEIFLGQAVAPSKAGAPNALQNVPVDDSFLDAALGLDQINVTASEDMDRTSTNRGVKREVAAPSATPYDGSGDIDTTNDSRKVESLTIRDESEEIRPERTAPPKKVERVGTGEIELVRDQYGMTDPSVLTERPERQVHDYDWFVGAMRDEAASAGKPSPATKPGASVTDSQKLRKTETASIIDPITRVSPPPAGHPATGAGRNNAEGVEKFIDEFKKEIELLRSREGDVPVAATPQSAPPPQGRMTWEEKVEAISVEHIRPFTKELTAMLAERIAERITAKIDPERLLSLIKEELVTAARKKER